MDFFKIHQCTQTIKVPEKKLVRKKNMKKLRFADETPVNDIKNDLAAQHAGVIRRYKAALGPRWEDITRLQWARPLVIH